MNNSLPRLIDGMIATLREEVIPHVEGEFARGQAFGLIYMLNSIRLRADWSPAFVGEQLAAQGARHPAADAAQQAPSYRRLARRTKFRPLPACQKRPRSQKGCTKW